MAWCRQAASHNRSHCSLRYMSQYGVTRPEWVNILDFKDIPAVDIISLTPPSLFSTPVIYIHDDAIKWKHFSHYWPFVQGIHQWPVNSQRPMTQSFDVFFDLNLTQQLSKQWRRRWFEMPSSSLWLHCNDQTWQHFLGRFPSQRASNAEL